MNHLIVGEYIYPMNKQLKYCTKNPCMTTKSPNSNTFCQQLYQLCGIPVYLFIGHSCYPIASITLLNNFGLCSESELLLYQPIE